MNNCGELKIQYLPLYCSVVKVKVTTLKYFSKFKYVNIVL